VADGNTVIDIFFVAFSEPFVIVAVKITVYGPKPFSSFQLTVASELPGPERTTLLPGSSFSAHVIVVPFCPLVGNVKLVVTLEGLSLPLKTMSLASRASASACTSRLYSSLSLQPVKTIAEKKY